MPRALRFGLVVLATSAAFVVATDATAATLGLYFDQQTWSTTAASDVPIECWLVLRDLDAGPGVSGWECVIETTADGAAPVLFWELLGDAPWNFYFPPEFGVGLHTPFPPASEVAVARGVIYPAGPGQVIEMRAQPFTVPSVLDPDGYPVWRPVIARGSEATLEVVEPASGASWLPELRLNPLELTLPPTIAVTGDLAFGAVPTGGEEVRTLSLRNDSASGIYGRLTLAGDQYALRFPDGPWTDDGRWLRLRPGEDVAVEVRFAPAAAGPSYGRLDLLDGGSLLVVPLSGGGDVAPPVALTPAVLEFGSVPPGGTTAQTVTIRNVSASLVTVTPGTPSAGFALVGDPQPVVLAPDEETTLTIAFVPLVAGLQALALPLGDDLPPVLGRGYAASDAGCVTAVADPAAGDFGTVVIGYPETREVTYTNQGIWDLTGEIRLEGDAAAFAITSGGGPVVLGPGEQHTVVVTCDPPAPGAWEAVLFGPDLCASVPLAAAAESVVIECAVTPPAVDFGVVLVELEGATTVVVRNGGNITLAGEVTLSGQAVFALTQSGGPFALAPGDSLMIGLSFTPTEPIAYASTLDLGTGDCEPVPVAGTGRLAAALCEVTDEIVDFGTVLVGHEVRRDVLVSNPGELPLVIAPVVTGEAFTLLAPAGADTLAPGATDTVAVRVRVAAAGPLEGALDLGHPACPPIDLVADGLYVDQPGLCDLEPALLEFGDVPIGSVAERAVAVINVSEAPLELELAIADGVAFSLVSPSAVTLAPHAAQWATVAFAPTAYESYVDHLVLAGGDCGPVPLQGSGGYAGCAIDPLQLAFPDIVVGTPVTRQVTVVNETDGLMPLVPVCDDPAFTPSPTALDLLPGGQAAIDVTFVGDAPGVYTGTLVLGPEICAPVALAATALDSTVACGVEPDAWDLPNAYVDYAYGTDVTITNRTGDDLLLAPAVLPADQGFACDGALQSVPPGESRTVALAFEAGAVGSYAAVLSLGPELCADVPLSATVVEAPQGECTVAPSVIALGEIPVGLFMTRNIGIVNTGDVTIVVNLTDEEGLVVYVAGGGVITLEPGESHGATGRFYAPLEGEFDVFLSFAGSGCGIHLTGFGTPAAYPCAIEPYIIDFGTLLVGQSSFRRFLIRNLTPTGIQLDIATQVGPFAVWGGGPRYLEPYYVLRPGVTFAPQAAGEYFLPIDLGPDDCGPALARGTAVAPLDGLVAREPRLDFGYLDVGTTGRLQLAVTNRGAAAATFAPTISGSEFALADDGEVRTLAPGETRELAVFAAPADIGLRRGRLALGVAGHPDVDLVAVARDVAAPAPRLEVVWADGQTAGSEPRALPAGVTSLAGDLRVRGLAPGAAAVTWRCALACDGGALADWQPIGDAQTIPRVDGAPLVILPDQPLHADGTGALVLATFRVVVAPGATATLRVSGGAERDWPELVFAETVGRGQAVITPDPDHGVARLAAAPADETPAATRLLAVYPNPFNPGTNLPFELAHAGPVRLSVFDVTGRRMVVVLDETLAAGPHVARWEGRDQAGRAAPSGTYYLRLEADGEAQMQKMTLLK